MPGPLQGQLVGGVGAAEHGVGQEAEVVDSSAGEPAEPARADRDRYGGLDDDLPLLGEADPQVDPDPRLPQVAEEQLEGVVRPGHEVGTLDLVGLGRAGVLVLLSAQRRQQTVRQLHLHRESLDHDLDADVGLGDEDPGRIAGSVVEQDEPDVRKLAQHQRLRRRPGMRDHDLGDQADAVRPDPGPHG